MYAFLLSTAVIFVAELGDKSQLMAMTFATRYRVRDVLIGITAATALVHLASVAIGAAVGTAFEHIHARVAQFGQTLRRLHGHARVGVVDDHAGVTPGREPHDIEFETAVRQRHAVKEMGFTVLTVFAHVEHGDFGAVVQPCLETGGRHELRSERSHHVVSVLWFRPAVAEA